MPNISDSAAKLLSLLGSPQRLDPLAGKIFETAIDLCDGASEVEFLGFCAAHREVLGNRHDFLHPSRKGEKESLLSHARRAREPRVAAKLLAMGAFPTRFDIDEGEVDEIMGMGCPDEERARFWLFCLEMPDYASMKMCSDALAGAGRTPADWAVFARFCLSRHELANALDIFDAQNLRPNPADLAALFDPQNFHHHFWDHFHCLSDADSRLERQIIDRAEGAPPQSAIDLAFTEAVIHGALPDLHWMLSKGWLPTDWAAVADRDRSRWRSPGDLPARPPTDLPRRSLLEAALAEKHRDLAGFLAQIPDALQALLQMAPPPERMRHFSCSDLAQLRAWGVNIFAKNRQRQTFLHLWALEDAKPRSGWAAIAKIDPAALESPDSQGKNPVELQLARLHGNARQDFERLTSGIAARHLRQAAPAIAKTPKAARPRL